MNGAYDKYIKVNIPLNEKEYRNGNGEGVWVEVDSKTKAAYDKDVIGPGYHGILANDSVYYPGLKCGDMIEFEMRGEKRPVVDYHNFLSYRSRISDEDRELLINMIAIKEALV